MNIFDVDEHCQFHVTLFLKRPTEANTSLHSPLATSQFSSEWLYPVGAQCILMATKWMNGRPGELHNVSQAPVSGSMRRFMSLGFLLLLPNVSILLLPLLGLESHPWLL